jgi:SPP1 gp7 family putative phage head morphogenesis protein
MATKPNIKNGAVGGALSPNAGISADYARPQVELITLMYRDTKRELEKLFKTTNFKSAMDSSVSSQGRILINALLKKWQPRFDELAKRATDRMIERTMRNSAVTLSMSLKEVSKDFTIDTSFSNEQLSEVIKASTQEAANLIKVIPQQFINSVQGQLMRSITTGNGMQDLVPFLKKKYQGDIKKARLVALDQTRKAYQSINTSRLKTLGVKKFIWIHSGGGKTVRPLHVAMSGKEYSFDDPPIIGEMYGSEVRGLPGDLPYCRCICKPVINFDLE